MADNKSNITNQQVELQAEANRLAEAFNLTVEQQQSLLTRILKGQIDSKSTLENTVLLMENEKDLLQAKLDITNKQVKAEEELIDITKSINSQTEKLLSTKGNLFELSKDDVKQLQENIKSQKKQLLQLTTQNNLTEDQHKLIESMREELVDSEKALEAQSKLMDTKKYAAMKAGFESATTQATELGGKVESMFKSLPGGGMLSKVLGLDDASKKLNTGVNAGFQAMNAHIAQGGGMMGGLKAGMQGFNSVVMMNPLLLVVAAGTALFGILRSVEKESQEIATATGMTVSQSKQLVENTKLHRNRLDTVLASSEDIMDVQKEMIGQYGAMGQLSNEIAGQVADTGKSFGYGAKTAGEMQVQLEQMGMSSKEAADAQDRFAADMIKSGVDVGTTMKDIAENGKLATKYLGGSPEVLKKAAIEAQKMGVNIATMVKVSDQLLNIEDSLTAQMEYQALSGKQINLDKARELALNGDIAGATKEVMGQVGTLADFNKMNRYEKEKLAQATGMEVDELQKSLAIQEKRGSMTEEQLAAAQGLGLSAEEIAKMSPEELKAAAQKAQATEQANKGLQDAVETLKVALLPVANALADVFAAIGPILTAIFTPIGWIASGLNKILNDFGLISDILKVVLVAVIAWWGYKKLMEMWANRQAKKELEAHELQQRMKKMSEEKLGVEQKITAEKKAQVQAGDDTVKQLQQEQAAKSGGGGGLIGKAKGLLSGGGGIGAKLMGGASALMNSEVGGMIKEKGIEMAMNSIMPVGDLSINPNGGPVVASPREGGIYQGTKNDGVSMSPGHGGGGGAPAIDYNALGAAVASAIAANPPVVNMDGQKVSKTVSAEQSFNRGVTP